MAAEGAVVAGSPRPTGSAAAHSIPPPAPQHFVQFYREDQVLIDAVATYIRQGLTQGAAIVIATEAHRQALHTRLCADGIDTAQLQRSERLLLLDAEQTLATFLSEGIPDRDRFFAQIGTLFADSARRFGQVFAFGEMVALLWKQDLAEAAVELEELWNELARQQPFTLFCAYPMLDCVAPHHIGPFAAVCARHAHVIPIGNAEAASSAEQRRSLAQLQQRALVLEKQLEQEVDIQRKMAHLAAIVETSDDAIVSKTLEGVIQTWNAGAQRLFGWSAEEAIGQPITLIIPPERLHEEQRILDTLKRGERINHFETIRVAKDGRRVEVSLTVSPIRTAAGTVIGASKIARDITPRNQRERALRERDEQLRLATEAAELGLWDVDLVTDTMFWPARVKAMFGISAEVPVSMADFYAGLHPADRERTSEAFAAAIDPQRRALYDVEYRTVGKEDGLIRWVTAKGRGQFDDQGRCVRVIGTAVDTTARKRIEALLRDREQALAHEAEALAQLNEWSCQLWRQRDLRQGIEAMLDAAIELLGADKGNVQLLGADQILRIEAQRGFDREFLEYFKEVAARDASPCGRALRAGEQILVEDIECDDAFAPLRPAFRSAGIRALISTPLIAADGIVQGVVSTHFSSVHRPSKQELDRLALYMRHASSFVNRCKLEQGLREADQRKNEFLALLSHELRNPLAPISHATEVLSRAIPVDSPLHLAVQMLERQSAQLTRLVDDLLDVGRITQGRVQLRLEPLELGRVIAQAVETIAPSLQEKQQEISIVTSGPRALYVQGDYARLVQCLCNVLGNASKYTDPRGKICIETRLEESSAVIEISDTGAGIPPEVLPRVFDLFVQSERTLDRAQGGLGIGLAVVKKLIEMHEGTVSARSPGLGQGSTFEIRLPHIPRPGALGREGVEFRTSPRRVLIVDDNVDGAVSLAMLLGLQGHEAETVHTAKEALERIAVFKPEVALLDIGLPEMDGYELARRLRAMPQLQGLRLIALTGYGQMDDRQRALTAGFDEHLTKPVSMPALERALTAESQSEPLSSSQLGSDQERAL